MITKEIIEKFARALRQHQDPARISKEVGYIEVYNYYDNESHCDIDTVCVSDLSREDIKAIGDWMGETVYLNAIDGSSIRINPDEDDVECGLWEEIYNLNKR